MSESNQRHTVVRIMRPYDAISVENRVLPGTPDVEYIGGWVELKWLRRWPRNADVSEVKIDHFTREQRVWLKRRWRRGGRAFLLLQANQRDWLLFDGETAAQRVGRVTRAELFASALVTWRKLNKKELQEWLTMDLPRLHEVRNSLFTASDKDGPSVLHPGNLSYPSTPSFSEKKTPQE